MLRFAFTDSEDESDLESASSDNNSSSLEPSARSSEILLKDSSDAASKEPTENVTFTSSDVDSTGATQELGGGVTLDDVLSALSLDDTIADGTRFELVSIETTSQDIAATESEAKESCLHSELARLKNSEGLNNCQEKLCVNNTGLNKDDDSEDDVSNDDDIVENTAADFELMRQLGLPVSLGPQNQPKVC